MRVDEIVRRSMQGCYLYLDYSLLLATLFVHSFDAVIILECFGNINTLNPPLIDQSPVVTYSLTSSSYFAVHTGTNSPNFIALFIHSCLYCRIRN